MTKYQAGLFLPETWIFRKHYWDWVARYQKETDFPQRHSLKEIIELGKKAIDWDRKWHAPDTK